MWGDIAWNLNIYGKILSVSNLTLRNVKLIIGKFLLSLCLFAFVWVLSSDAVVFALRRIFEREALKRFKQLFDNFNTIEHIGEPFC